VFFFFFLKGKYLFRNKINNNKDDGGEKTSIRKA